MREERSRLILRHLLQGKRRIAVPFTKSCDSRRGTDLGAEIKFDFEYGDLKTLSNIQVQRSQYQVDVRAEASLM